MSNKIVLKTAKKKFKGLRGLVAEARDFRGGTKTGDYLDVRLANALEKLLNERDTSDYEYFVAHPRLAGSKDVIHRGPWSEADVDQWIYEWDTEVGKPGVFEKWRRTVGKLEKAP